MEIIEAERILEIKESYSLEDLNKIYREKAKKAHPDTGGTEEQMKELNEAFYTLEPLFKNNFSKREPHIYKPDDQNIIRIEEDEIEVSNEEVSKPVKEYSDLGKSLGKIARFLYHLPWGIAAFIIGEIYYINSHEQEGGMFGIILNGVDTMINMVVVAPIMAIIIRALIKYFLNWVSTKLSGVSPMSKNK